MLSHWCEFGSGSTLHLLQRSGQSNLGRIWQLEQMSSHWCEFGLGSTIHLLQSSGQSNLAKTLQFVQISIHWEVSGIRFLESLHDWHILSHVGVPGTITAVVDVHLLQMSLHWSSGIQNLQICWQSSELVVEKGNTVVVIAVVDDGNAISVEVVKQVLQTNSQLSVILVVWGCVVFVGLKEHFRQSSLHWDELGAGSNVGMDVVTIQNSQTPLQK